MLKFSDVPDHPGYVWLDPVLNLDMDKQPIYVDASHTVTDALPLLMELEQIFQQNGLIIDDKLRVDMTYRGQPPNDTATLLNAGKKARFKLLDRNLLKRVLNVCFRWNTVDNFKIRRSSGEGYTGNAVIDRTKKTLTRAERLKVGYGGYLYRSNNTPNNTIFSDYTYEDESLYTAITYARVEARYPQFKPATWAISTRELDADDAKFYGNKRLVGKKVALYCPPNLRRPGRSRTIVAQPLPNHQVSLLLTLVDQTTLSFGTTPVFEFPVCSQINSRLNKVAGSCICGDFSRFGPSHSAEMHDEINRHVSREINGKTGYNGDYIFALLTQNNEPQQLAVMSEIPGKRVYWHNIRAGQLDGIAATSKYNAFYNLLICAHALKACGVLSEFGSIDDICFPSNNKYALLIVGDGLLFKADPELVKSFIQQMDLLASDLLCDGEIKLEAKHFCGFSVFPDGLCFREDAILKCLRPERSAHSFKYRPNPVFGLNYVMNAYMSIPDQYRIVKQSEKITALLRQFLDLDFSNFENFDPNVQFDEVTDFSWRNANVLDVPDTYYYRFSRKEVLDIIEAGHRKYSGTVDDKYVQLNSQEL